MYKDSLPKTHSKWYVEVIVTITTFVLFLNLGVSIDIRLVNYLCVLELTGKLFQKSWLCCPLTPNLCSSVSVASRAAYQKMGHEGGVKHHNSNSILS